MRSRLSRRARETSCSMADGLLASDDIHLAGVSGRVSSGMTPFCDSGSYTVTRQPLRSTFVRRSTPVGNVSWQAQAGTD